MLPQQECKRQIDPEPSTNAIVYQHPDAKYFSAYGA
jgi:cobalamin-dependent methionine synthase I